MTDSTGVFQHAMFTVPNFSEGYCTDDNARAFILAVLLDELEEKPERTAELLMNFFADKPVKSATMDDVKIITAR